MARIYLKDIETAAKNRPSGYMDDVLSRAHRVEDGIIYMEDAKYMELVQKYTPKKSPSLAKQAFNFAKSTTKHVAGGMMHVDSKTYQERVGICNGCDRLKDDKCIECGCFVKLKAKWASESCPIGKWDILPDPPKRGCGCGKKT